MSDPVSHPPRHISLAQIERLKNWRVAHHKDQPVECYTWEGVLTLWMMGWVGWLPAFAFEAPWAYPLCLLGMWTPVLYARLRAHAHATQRLRCDWLDLVT